MTPKGDLRPFITPSISTEENTKFCLPTSLNEVWGALKDIPNDSSLGPDGFSLCFFQECWNIVKSNLLEATIEFFREARLPPYYTTSFIITIPKENNPINFSKFWPISLYLVAYKIFSKILVNRLVVVLLRLISEKQGSFIQGRSIHENISLAKKILQSLNKKVMRGNVMIKVEMTKAYDRLKWPFLLRVMEAFGFLDQWNALIHCCISSPYFQ